MPIQPIQPINQTFPTGQQGEITYKPNWGQPITETGQWWGASQPTRPAIDPHQVVSDNLTQLWANFKQQAETLRAANLDPDVHNRILAGWQNEYDQAKAEQIGIQTQLGLIRQSQTAGGLTSEAAREAGLRMLMPKETVDAMFPKPEGVTPSARGMSPSGGRAYFGMFTDPSVRESLITDPKGWWAKKHRKYIDPEKMEDMYFQWRLNANLDDPSNANQVPGFNDSFKRAMNAQPDTKKVFDELVGKGEKSSLNMRIAFTKPSQLTDIAARKATGVSPLGNAFMPKPTQQVPEDMSQMSDEELRRIAGGM